MWNTKDTEMETIKLLKMQKKSKSKGIRGWDATTVIFKKVMKNTQMVRN